MEKELTTDQVKRLLDHVIKTIDRWWDKTADSKSGCFPRLPIPFSVVYGDYVEWRYEETRDCRDYASIIISLEYEGGTDYIRMTLRKMKNEVFTEYDPFCEIRDGKVDVTISEDTGGYDEWFSVFGKGWINELTDDITTTVKRFTEPSYDEENANADMDDVSKTLSAHDIQDCMIKAMRVMLIDRDIVNELTRLRSKYVAQDLPTAQCKYMLGYAIDATPKRIVTRIVAGNDFTLCRFTCEPDNHGPHEFIIRYNSCDTGFQYEQGFVILYKDPDGRCFEYTADGLDTEKIFKPFVNILRNELNYELYLQLPKINAEEAKKQQQETCEESKEETMDTETKTTAVKPGLKTKEIFVLDENYFKSGDIYLLHISPKFHGDIHNGTALAPDAHLPSMVYAICSDTNGGTVIEFMFKPTEPLVGIDDLVWIQVHAEDIENGLITVKRVLTNESLIQNADEDRYGALS